MPELPEVETVRRGLAPVIEGRTFARVVQRRTTLRVPMPENFVARMTGRRVISIGRRAKYLLWTLDNGEVMVVHLGMSGRMSILSPPDKDGNGRHDHVVFHMDDGVRVVFTDPRRFGLITLVAENDLEDHRLFCHLGPEPLGNAFDGGVLSSVLRGRKSPIKTTLLDQKVVVGLGNIYVCEALFRAGISPRRSAATVAGKRADRLVPHIRDVLTEAIEAGGSSLRDYAGADGELGYFQNAHAVYGREGEPCPGCACGGGVQRIVQSGRSTFFCAARQR
ncbi:MAG TPA: bifunctional DNA-formamidopyrimidine glycosylase/DNA-(apurinic or apyrimidinic site) lyase [Sneathiellales bacterium]|nr:bifunctional DNA-formamidopyrimidine glycosylase/DNA-(apurinic or apyrimidinic site) lyase [Sneathiellales bacterium]